MTTWIQTYSKERFDYEALLKKELPPSTVRLKDIARSLANLPRYLGHTKGFYSVAEHSLLMTKLVPKEFQLTALLHDAAEAYVGDMPRPLKDALGEHSPYVTYEKAVHQLISDRYGTVYPYPQEIHDADRDMIIYECRYVLDTDPPEWGYDDPPGGGILLLDENDFLPYSRDQIEQVFLKKFGELM